MIVESPRHEYKIKCSNRSESKELVVDEVTIESPDPYAATCQYSLTNPSENS
jgi:hypothetical protein